MNLIFVKGYKISEAAKVTNINYPTARFINKVYKNTGRIDKKNPGRGPRIQKLQPVSKSFG